MFFSFTLQWIFFTILFFLSQTTGMGPSYRLILPSDLGFYSWFSSLLPVSAFQIVIWPLKMYPRLECCQVVCITVYFHDSMFKIFPGEV